MSTQKYTVLQIAVICFLVFLLGIKALWRNPDWFDGKQPGLDEISATDVRPYITLGSATSTEDAGFFNHILPIFRAATGLAVHVEAVGSGQALAIAAQGDYDVLLVHDRIAEDNFVAEGYGIDRRDVMRDDFVIVGPSADPAGIRGSSDAVAAFALIAAKGVPFVSRGERGGTYVMERRLWRSAGIEPMGQAWYRDLDEGIGTTLNFAAAINAYVLTDRGAWVNFKNRRNLVILTDGDPVLFNFYASILVNPAKWPDTKFKEAKKWHNWLTSRTGLEAITSYRIDGQELFFPPYSRSDHVRSPAGSFASSLNRAR